MRIRRAAAIAALCFLTGTAAAATFNVNLPTDLPDVAPGNGICSASQVVVPNTAVCSLRAAIMEANALAGADEIVLQSGATYTLTRTNALPDNANSKGDLNITTPMQIYTGGDTPVPAVIDANHIDRVLTIGPATGVIELRDLDIVGGRRNDCSGSSGNGINIISANSVEMTRLRIHDNGGDGCNVAAVTSNISGVALTESQIYANDAGFTASGVGIKTINGSSIYRNAGNGIQLTGVGSFTIYNSTISGNGSSFSSAGITISNSSGEISATTVVDNDRYGISAYGSSAIRVYSSLFAAHTQNCDIPDSVMNTSEFSSNFYDDAGCAIVDGDQSLRDQTAYVGPLGFYGGPTPTHRPLTTVSPVIDYIPEWFLAPEDQRHMTRAVAFKGGANNSDIGSVEIESDVIYFDSLEWY